MTKAIVRKDLDVGDVPYIKEGVFCDFLQYAVFDVISQDENINGLNEESSASFNVLLHSRTLGRIRVRSIDFDFEEDSVFEVPNGQA